MNKKTIYPLYIIYPSLILFTIFIVIALLFNAPPTSEIPSVSKISEFSVAIDGRVEKVSLPYSFKDLEPRTPLTLTTDFKKKNGEFLYIKSVYAPLKVYANEKLIYEYGGEGTYPKFMKDPATLVKVLQLPDSQEDIRLELEFLSPISRSVLTSHPLLLASEAAIIKNLFNTMGFSFVFSIIQMFIGIFLILLAIFIVFFEPKGIAFFWLGLFALATGVWTFGECNLTALLFQNYTLLYLLAFLGLFSFPIPLIYFGLNVVNFQNKKPLTITALFVAFSCSIAMLLQLLGLISLSKSMYFFHFLVPLSLSFFAAYILYEAIKYKNKNAMNLFLPVIILPIFSILELINYQLRFTNVLSLLFQIGIVIFIFVTSIMGAIFIKDSLFLKDEKRKLQYEVSLMEKQVASQKKHNSLLLENAEKIKIQKHDLHHQLAVLQSLSRDENKGKLTKYLDTLIDEIPSDHGRVYCENIGVNAIVCHYANLAKKHSIELKINLCVPEDTKHISDSNLCIIFGNLFENAIEACKYIKDGNKFIHLHSKLQYETLIITMDNSFDGNYIKNNKKFISRKHDSMGTGLVSIQTVAQKHGGKARFNIEDLIFLSSIYIKL